MVLYKPGEDKEAVIERVDEFSNSAEIQLTERQ